MVEKTKWCEETSRIIHSADCLDYFARFSFFVSRLAAVNQKQLKHQGGLHQQSGKKIFYLEEIDGQTWWGTQRISKASNDSLDSRKEYWENLRPARTWTGSWFNKTNQRILKRKVFRPKQNNNERIPDEIRSKIGLKFSSNYLKLSCRLLFRKEYQLDSKDLIFQLEINEEDPPENPGWIFFFNLHGF